ncbi:DUF3696 domain-containing protein [Vreelandella zhanjiangensis]|uniref:DUF3696 domain-containing protein n=1 Tax=Vreelandella zhanjiangensis TaxID=1121960 RepID=UPI00402A78E2
MISELTLHNFKCFKDKTIQIKPLTFLSGINGMGKSTIIQSLLLLRQSHSAKHFSINGNLFEFGYFDDLYSEAAEDESLEITLRSDSGEIFTWSSNIFSDQDGELTSVVKSWPEHTDFDSNLFGGLFQFLSAERWGPRVSLPLNRVNTDKYYLGKHGENLVSVLKNLEGKRLLNDDFPVHENTKSRDTFSQINAWMNEISPASTFDVKAIKEADSGVYTFAYRSHIGKSRSFRPTNVGFGLSYTLPILTALVTAQKNSLILIENPEAHLHPKAQLIIGKLLGLCANAGVQLIIESHSDHVLNGIRIAVKENLIDSEKVALHFINRSDPLDISTTDVLSPVINKNGKLNKWPDGFFDEWDNALDKLI